MDTEIRLRIDERRPFAGGMAFGEVGPYQRLDGTVEFAVDPDEPAYRKVVDLRRAPRNEKGLVEFSTDLVLLKPASMALGNRRLLYDVNNRGNKRVLSFFNDAPGTNDPIDRGDAGNGFLMRRGYTVAWSGWQGDLLPGDSRMTMRLPVAQGVRGPYRAEFVTHERGVTCLPLSGNDFTVSYPASSMDTAKATFTARPRETAERVAIPPDAWRFAETDSLGVPSDSPYHCYLPEGFKPGWIYELVYEAADPHVMGLGFTGIRDLVSFLLHSETDSDGAENPLLHDGSTVEKAYAYGRSQCGRLLREFVYRGYNEDAQGRQVFAAIHPTVSGGGRVTLNYRFAQPGRYPRQHEDHLYPSDQFPFAYHVTTDHLTGQEDGILRRPDTDPLVVHTQTASEYWQRRGSLVHTDTRGNDLPEHDMARVYLIAGSQHSALPEDEPLPGPHRYLTNPLESTQLMRSLLDAMDLWATDGVSPPDSQVPTKAAGSAVQASEVAKRFPSISDVECPAEANRLFVEDHGPDFAEGIQSKEPPEEDRSREYAVLVSQVDDDGNEIAGVRLPDVEVPLSAYTGWNLWFEDAAGDAMFSIIGSCFPLPLTAAQASDAGDERQPIDARYGTREGYVRAVAAAARRLAEHRLLLEDDAEAYIERAKSSPAFDHMEERGR